MCQVKTPVTTTTLMPMMMMKAFHLTLDT